MGVKSRSSKAAFWSLLESSGTGHCEITQITHPRKKKYKNIKIGRGKLGRGVEIAASSKSRPARSWRVAMLLTEPHGARSIGRTRSSKVAWSRGARYP